MPVLVADQLGDDQVGPGPAEQDRACRCRGRGGLPGTTTRVSSARRFAPSVCAASSSARSSWRVVLAITSTFWKKRADEDDRDLGRVVDAEHRDRQRAERRRRQVAEELDERLGQPRERRRSVPHRMPSGTPNSDEIRKPQKMTLMLCHRLSCSHGSSARRGGVAEAGDERARHLVRRRQEDRVGARAARRASPLGAQPAAFSSSNAARSISVPALA